MPFTLVKVEIAIGENVELALPIDVPSRILAAKIMRERGKLMRTGETPTLFFKTSRGDKRIPPNATLGELGITDGQQLRVKREMAGVALTSTAHAYLRTETGELLPLETNTVIMGRKDTQHQAPLDLDLSKHDPSHAVSRRHACIGRDGRNYYLLDLQSTNGTRLNGETLIPGKRMPLQDGDSVEFGLGMRVTFVTAKPGSGELG